MLCGETLRSVFPGALRGRVFYVTHEAGTLKNNALRDPFERDVAVYTPPGYTDGCRLPLLVDLAGYGSSGLAHVGWKSSGKALPNRLDRLIGSGVMPPVVVAFPDCHTVLGGNQYINSCGVGRYADYLIDDIVPLVESRFGCGGTGKRGLFGKSSGGFGALWHGMHYPDFWSVIASSAGDCGFEITYLPGIYSATRVLARYGMSVATMLRHMEANSSREAEECLMICAMAATYDPDQGSEFGVRMPVDAYSGEIIPEYWNNWLRHDPALIVHQYLDSLHRLKGIWLECGRYDEFNIQFGTRRISRVLQTAGIAHEYEEFDGGHRDTDYRLDRFLPWMARVLTEET